MSTFTHKDYNIPVALPEGLSEEQFSSFKPFNIWIQTLTESLKLQAQDKSHPFHSDPYTLNSITVQTFDLFSPSKLGFVKLAADVSNGAGEKLHAVVFLRGPSVAMLVMLIPDDIPESGDSSDERYVLLTVQPRVAAGSLAFVELPAGMVDDGTFVGAAAKEIEEELGLKIPESELLCLSEMAQPPPTGPEAEPEALPRAMYPSPGACDEFLTIYAHERRVPRAELKEWTGRLTGLREEGEKITLKLVRMQDLWREGSRDGKCLAALSLWEGLRRENRV